MCCLRAVQPEKDNSKSNIIIIKSWAHRPGNSLYFSYAGHVSHTFNLEAPKSPKSHRKLGAFPWLSRLPLNAGWKCHFLTCEMESRYPFIISSSLVPLSEIVWAPLIPSPPGVNDAPPVPSVPWRGWQWKRWRMKRTQPRWYPWLSMPWCTLSSMRYGG